MQEGQRVREESPEPIKLAQFKNMDLYIESLVQVTQSEPTSVYAKLFFNNTEI